MGQASRGTGGIVTLFIPTCGSVTSSIVHGSSCIAARNDRCRGIALDNHVLVKTAGGKGDGEKIRVRDASQRPRQGQETPARSHEQASAHLTDYQ